MPILKKREHNDGVVTIEWNIPKGCFTAIGLLGLIGTVAISAINTSSPEVNAIIMQTCKCVAVPLLFVASAASLHTGLKRK